MFVFEAMTPDVHIVGQDTTIQRAAELMRDLNIGFVPILKDGDPIGVLTDRDLVTRALTRDFDPARVTVSQVMTESPIWIYEDEDVDRAIALMCDKRISRLLVKSRGGDLVGILAAADLASIAGEDKVGELMQVLGCGYWQRHLAAIRVSK
jgi:CBS domain-containing protein